MYAKRLSQLVTAARLHDVSAAGAELANILNEAALEAVRRGGSIITTEDVYNGMDRILQVPTCPCLAGPRCTHASQAM